MPSFNPPVLRKAAIRLPPLSRVVRQPQSVCRSKRVRIASEVGPVMARRIIEGGPYLKVGDLRRVKGIGEKRLAEFLPHVTAG